MFLRAAATPRGKELLKALVQGQLVYGARMVDTRHLVTLRSGPTVNVACALDALIEGFFQDLEVLSSCPHCQEPIKVEMASRQIVSANPESTVLWMGVSPKGEGPTIETVCPYINFFSSSSHASNWRQINIGQVGVLLDLPQSHEFLKEALPEA